MNTSIDVSGLSREAVQMVESLVGLLRAVPREQSNVSIFDLFGKAETLRTGEDIAEQVREERDSWGEL